MIFRDYRACVLRKSGMTVGKEYAVDSLGKVEDDGGKLRTARLLIWEEEEAMVGIKDSVGMRCKQKPYKDGKADRFNAGKPQLSYMLDAPNAMIGLSRAFEAGAEKYSRDNWKKGLDRNELVDCLMRHLVKAQAGELADEETGVDHLYHVVWNAVVLAEQYGNIQEVGDGKV